MKQAQTQVTTTQPTMELDEVTTTIIVPTTDAELTTIAAVYTMPDISLNSKSFL